MTFEQILAYVKDIAIYVMELVKELMTKFFPAEEA